MTETVDFPEFDPESTTPRAGWLPSEDIRIIRNKMPIVYVDAVPVRTDPSGDVIEVGLLLRVTENGQITRAVVSGRVLYHERIRDALVRHVEKDLGPMALPTIPASPQPFTVAEYLPTPGITPYYDPRQHAVSLGYIVPVRGDCAPQQDALELAWLTPEDALRPEILAEMAGGQDVLLRTALAHVGRLA